MIVLTPTENEYTEREKTSVVVQLFNMGWQSGNKL